MQIDEKGIQINKPADIESIADLPIVKIEGDLVFANKWKGDSTVFVATHNFTFDRLQSPSMEEDIEFSTADIPLDGTYTLAVYATAHAFAYAHNETQEVDIQVKYGFLYDSPTIA